MLLLRPPPGGQWPETGWCKDGQATAYETFAEGWLQGRQVLGRPVDLLILPDGSLLVSDDTANAIYRIHYTGSG